MGAYVDVGSIESSDVEEHCQALAPTWNVALKQISRGPFHAHLEYLRTDNLMCYTERWSQRLQVQGTSPKGFFTVGTTASPGTVWDGEQVQPASLPVKQPGAEVDFCGTQDHAVLLVLPSALVAYFGEERAAGLTASRHTMGCDSRVSVELGAAIRRLIGQHMGRPTAVGNAPEARSVEWELLSFLELAIDSKTPRCGRKGRFNRHKAFKRAVEFAGTQRLPISIPDLAQQVGVSQRTLEVAFQEAVGLPPSKYFRWARLNGLRSDLLRADPVRVTTTELSAGWGFYELGRMAVEYRRLFGESPSATLSRRYRPPEFRLTGGRRAVAEASSRREVGAAAS